MNREQYERLYKEFVVKTIKEFESCGWTFIDDRISDTVAIFDLLLEYGGRFRYYTPKTRLLALFLHGVVMGMQLSLHSEKKSPRWLLKQIKIKEVF